MDVDVHNQKPALSCFDVLPSNLKHHRVAIDSVSDDEELTLDLVKSPLPQEELEMIDEELQKKCY